MSDRRRLQLFAVLVVACVAGGAVAIVSATGGAGEAGAPAGALARAHADARPALLVRNLDRTRPREFGQLAIAQASPGGARSLVPMRCERVHFSAGAGLCLARGSGFAAGYRARIFGPRLDVRGEVALAGIPSRARVSPDGRYATATMFVTGHSYADQGSFSTTTTLIDVARGRRIAELEDFRTTRRGRLVTADDVNYWGVTFRRDSDRFYATLATGGRIHLVEGSVSQRRMRVVHETVECPSLSPDETRIAFKKRVGPAGKRWRIHVLDLRTMHETALAETRNVDDQVEWLDGSTVLYGLDEDVWSVPADGSGAPRRHAADADSPAALRR
jgi:hypothetical protein